MSTDTSRRPARPTQPIPSSLALGLRAEVEANVRDRLVVAVAGPRGAGKSLLLNDLASVYRAAGVDTRRGESEVELIDLPPRCAVLVDDAHTLGEDALNRIHSLVDDPGVHLVVAYRPWPQPPGLLELIDALEQHHPPIVLGARSREEIATYAATVLGRPAPPRTVDAVAELTGGLPWLVQRTLLPLHDEPPSGSFPIPVPPAVVEDLRHELDRLDDDLREFLLALAVGFDLGGLPRELADGPVTQLLAEARAAGLLLPDDSVVPVIGQALLQTAPTHKVRALQRDLVDRRVQSGQPLDDVARAFAGSGLQDTRVAQCLERLGDEALPTQPRVAVELFDQAVAAGGDELATAARRAQAAVLAGELDRAGQILEGLLTVQDPPDLRRAVDVAAAVWAQRGMLGRSADAYRWLGAERVGSSAPMAAVTMFGAGDRAGAQAMLDAAGPPPPTLHAASVAAMGEGVSESIAGSPTKALATLVRASDMKTSSGTVEPLPDVPAALAALVALQAGELDVAESVLEGAITKEQGGRGAQPRLLLLSAWTALMRDRPDRARAVMADATGMAGALAPRDEIFYHALEVGLARRTDDVPGLVRAWHRTREVVLHFPVDLFVLPALGEFLVTAARLRDSERLESHLSEAWSLLARLGDPPLWAVPLHWSAVQGAILADRPMDLAPHAAALVRASQHSPLAAAMSAAGRAWLAVLAGDFDPAQVESAARGLAAAGLTWDASRLAAHAAARAQERKDMARLLECARDLRPAVSEPATAGEAPKGIEQAATTEETLSPREREVARLVLAGKTYREIGEAIYISPRTVEHHVARIRRRLSATTRSELLARLRVALGEDDYATSS